MVIPDSGEFRDGFRFAGGHPVLDLCATLKGRLKPVRVDALQSPSDLGRWLLACGLVPAADPEDADLATARALREAIYALATAKAGDTAFPPRAVTALNEIAASPAAAAVLGSDGSARLEGRANSLLGFLARDAVTLLGGRAGVIRQCEGDGCAVLFHDQSRASARRWCSMAVCGNRAKAAAFRRRERAD